MKRKQGINSRVFIGTTEISGIGVGLRNAFRGLGVSAETVFLKSDRFQYDDACDISLLGRLCQSLSEQVTLLPNLFLPLKWLLQAFHRLLSVFVLIGTIFRFDVYIFLYGQTITNSRLELVLLRALRKKIIFLYVGSDVRPTYINGFRGTARSFKAGFKRRVLVWLSKRRLSIQEAYADICINSPATAHFHSRPYVNCFALGIPKELEVNPFIDEENIAELKKNIRILHCPSNAEAKGSVEILAALARIKSAGYPIEVVKLEGVPNKVVLEELARCDFVVDQLYSDTPMAAFATEAACFGKPAIVGGYFAKEMINYIQPEDIPPTLYVHPDDIESAIMKLIVDDAFRVELGKKAKVFVNSRWSNEEVARRYIKLIDDTIPSQWWCDPQQTRYVHGAGISEVCASSLVRDMIDRFGKHSLQVSDKPELENQLEHFSKIFVKQL